ncbi:P-loop NTPase fold protein [Shewanella sp. SG41-3]|uniref:P-loop NTPase fold protein n=1 Tax=Shewanella sp. SG41-3 TaxID=2760977 RepID=UPI00160281DA|nr:P-loop NTPase fold protein [Shewanella sp. SG41-3]MBB1475848.1 DEAD/DEAH box helicase family protein [Shewanella sp. SG41-3]
MNNSSDTEHLNQEKSRLRDYQQAAVDALSKALYSGPNIGLLIMAIGTGKSLVIAQAIASNTIFRRSIVIVKLREHKKQLSMLLNDLGELSTSFDVITYKTFSDNQGKYSNADVYYLVDLDGKAAINASELIRKSNKESKVLIATPTPSLDLVEYANRNIIFEYSISQAIVDGYCVPVKVIQILLDLRPNTNSLDVDISSSSVHLAQVETQLSHWLSQVKINHGDKIVVLCRNIMEAGYYFQTLSHLLSGVTGIAINTSLITSDSPDPGQLIRTFQNDESAHIALSVSLLLEGGYDLGNVVHLVNFKPLSQAHRLVGLVARPSEGKSFGTIWDYAGLNWNEPSLGVDLENSQLSVTNRVYRIEPKGDQENKTDLLGRGTLVHVLKGIIESDSKFKPFTVGLFGKWGTGKSTIINLLKRDFEANSNYRFSIFNAWENEHCDFMAGALAHHLATDLYSQKSLLKRIYMLGKYRIFLQRDTLRNALIWWVLIGIAALAVISTGLIDSFLAESDKSPIIVSGVVSGFALTIFGIAKNLWASPFLKKINSISNSPDYSKHLGVAQYLKEDIRALIDSYSFSAQRYFKTKFNYLFGLKKNNLPENTQNVERKIILVIEDLDRCSPDRIVNTLEAIRLLASLDNVIVVFAVDGEQLLNAVALKSLNSFIDQKQAQQIARDFLGKLFQLVIELDEPSSSQLSVFIQKRLYDSMEIDTEITDSFKRSKRLKQQAKEAARNEFKVDWEEVENEEEHVTETSDSYLRSTIAELEYFTLLTDLFNIGNPRALIRLHNSVTLLKGLFPELISDNEKLKEHMFFLFLNEIYTIDIPMQAFDIPKFFKSLNDASSSRDNIIQYYYSQEIENSDPSTLQKTLNRVRKVSMPYVKC